MGWEILQLESALTDHGVSAAASAYLSRKSLAVRDVAFAREFAKRAICTAEKMHFG
jgi:hypothetical protein